jgi:solute carrier family 35, member E1
MTRLLSFTEHLLELTSSSMFIHAVVNKKILNVLPLPWAVGSVQLGIGMLYVVFLWLLRLRKVPVLAPGSAGALGAVGFWHCLGQLFSMVSLGAGPVSFTHIVKALEPFFSAGVSAVWLHQYMAWPVYASLIPVVGGVGYACLKEREFSWLSFWMAMGSNVAFAFRAVLSKQAMVLSQASKHLTSSNIFGVVTLLAFVLSIPMAAVAEGKVVFNSWKEATTDKVILKAVEVLKPAVEEGGQPIVEKITEVIRTPAAATPKALVKAIVISGLFHYLNNEVMYMALDNVHPITLAVGNTMKRVFIIMASVLVFRNTITLQAGVGSAVGIGGVLLYSLAKQHYEAKEKQQQQAQQPVSKASK